MGNCGSHVLLVAVVFMDIALTRVHEVFEESM